MVWLINWYTAILVVIDIRSELEENKKKGGVVGAVSRPDVRNARSVRNCLSKQSMPAASVNSRARGFNKSERASCRRTCRPVWSLPLARCTPAGCRAPPRQCRARVLAVRLAPSAHDTMQQQCNVYIYMQTFSHLFSTSSYLFIFSKFRAP
jgi:hypothetical protein